VLTCYFYLIFINLAQTPAPFGSPATPFGQQQPAASNAFGGTFINNVKILI